MNEPITQAEAHVQRFWNVDGLHEIAVAILFGLIAGLQWTFEFSTLATTWKGVCAIAMFLAIGGFAWLERRVIQAIRTRFTYPRAGFVVFRKPRRNRQLIGGAVALLVNGTIIILAFQ